MKRRTTIVLLTVVVLSACAAATRYAGPVSDHYDGRRFHDSEELDVGFTDLIRFYFTREPGVWKRDLSIPSGPKPADSVADGDLKVTLVNHATVLIQADGLNILTDPIWSERASPVTWAGPRRFRPPAIAFDDLPRIDVVLLSHNHYDHFDLPSLLRLKERHDPWFLMPLGDAALLRKQGFEHKLVELDWNQPWTLPNGCQLHALQARHWSSRGRPGDRNLSLWLSYVIATRGGPVYFAGDTGYGAHFSAASARFGAMRLALLPIGAYLPRWLTDYQHLDPKQSVQAHLDLRAAQSLGIHYGTFELADDGQRQPIDDLAAAMQSRQLDNAGFTAAEFGNAKTVPALAHSTGCAI